MAKQQFMFVILVGMPGLILVPMAIVSLLVRDYLWAAVWFAGLLAAYVVYLALVDPEKLRQVRQFPAGSPRRKLHGLILLYASVYAKTSILVIAVLIGVIIGGSFIFFAEIEAGGFTFTAGIALSAALASLAGGAAMLYLEFSMSANDEDDKRERITQLLTDLLLPGFEEHPEPGDSNDLLRLPEREPVDPRGPPPPAS